MASVTADSTIRYGGTEWSIYINITNEAFILNTERTEMRQIRRSAKQVRSQYEGTREKRKKENG